MHTVLHLPQGIRVMAVSDVTEEQVERNAFAVLVLDILKLLDNNFETEEGYAIYM